MTEEKTLNEEEKVTIQESTEADKPQEVTEEEQEPKVETSTKQPAPKKKPKPYKAPQPQKSEFDREYFSDEQSTSDIQMEKKFEKLFNERLNKVLPQAVEMAINNRDAIAKKEEEFEKFRQLIQDDDVVEVLKAALKDKPLEEITENLSKIGGTINKKIKEREGYIVEQFNTTKTVTYNNNSMDELMDREKAIQTYTRGLQSLIPNFQKNK